MTDTGWIVVRNWARYQHYDGSRGLVWLKLYVELSGRDDWLNLTFAERGLLVSLWIAYARANGQLTTSTARHSLGQRINSSHLDSLNKAGFIEIVASKPLALLARAPEEKEKETDPSISPQKPKPRKGVTGWKLVRGSHGMTHVPDPFGTDRPPADAPLLKEIQ